MTADVSVADVIIVGSGPAGVSVAWPLVEAGARVLMLDGSDAELPAAPPHTSLREWRDDSQRWRHELDFAGPVGETGVSPKFATPLARATMAGFTYAAGLESDNFFAVGSLAAGGLSRIWGALATRYGERDLAAFGEVSSDIVASYDRVMKRIGVSGPNAPENVDDTLLCPPVERLFDRYRQARRKGNFSLTRASNAVLTGPRDGRGECTACGLCLYGCSRESIYHSALELPALRRFANFDYRPQVRVERLSGEPEQQIVEARRHGDHISYRAPVVVLAAGTLMTSSLALRRLGMAGQPVRLETSPVGGLAFLAPSLIGAALPDRSFGLGQLFYTLEPAAGVEAAGVFYGADTLPLSPIADRLPFTRATSLRAARALAPALMFATCYLPGRFSDNRMTIEDDGAAGRIHIEGRSSEASTEMLRRAVRELSGNLRRLGAWAVPGSLQLLAPGADAHPAGTLPMGANRTGATDWSGELKGAPRVFVADGAALPTLSARHPTLTIMANADRIGRALARRFAAVANIVMSTSARIDPD